MGGCSTPPLPAHLCLAPATGLLQGLRCRGYAARAMLYGATPQKLCCRNHGSWLMMMMVIFPSVSSNGVELSGMNGSGPLVGVRSPWPLLTTYSSTDTAESSTAVQLYSSTAPAGQQDSRIHTTHAEQWSADLQLSGRQKHPVSLHGRPGGAGTRTRPSRSRRTLRGTLNPLHSRSGPLLVCCCL